MTASDRFLAWFAQTLPRHEPRPDLSFTEAQARFTAVVEIRLGLYLAFLAGTSAIHVTDETYGGGSRLLAPDLVSLFERLGAHAGGVRAFLDEAACDLAGGAA